MKDLFISFLEENDALDKFKEALVVGDEPDVDEYFRKVDPFDFLYASCVWAKLEDGHEYWSDLNSKWQIVLEQNETNN